MFAFLAVLWCELVPFSVWLNTHAWTIEVIFATTLYSWFVLGQVMLLDTLLRGVKSVPGLCPQHKMVVSVSLCFSLGRGHSVPVLPLAVLSPSERGLRQSPPHLQWLQEVPHAISASHSFPSLWCLLYNLSPICFRRVAVEAEEGVAKLWLLWEP